MKTRLLRAWTLILDLVMLIMLFAAPVQTAQTSNSRHRQPTGPARHEQDAGAGDFMQPNPAYVHIERHNRR